MNLSSISIKRKVAMSCFIIMLVLLGLKSYQKIGIDTLPKFDVPYVQITTVYPGASPEEIEVEVAKRIEDAVASMDGLKHVTSICMENVAATTLEFQLGTDVDTTIHEVREKLNTIADDFPSSVETPQLGKVNINAIPVVTLFVTGSKTLDELYDYVDDKLSDQFSSIPGVGAVRIHGGNEVQLHVVLNRQKLAASNLTVNNVINRITSNNIKLPAGRLKSKGTEMTITYDAEFRDIQSLRELEVGSITGKRIYLGDIAEIELRSKEIRQEGYYNGKLGVAVEIVKKSDANAVKVINAVQKKFDLLKSSGLIPGGIRLHWFKDSGAFIRASVNDAWSSIFLGILLTATILFLFLHEPRSTFIISITMPVSIIITFAVMQFLDYTFDMMTLVALGCSAGVLVTNSVVVIENIFKKLHSGKSPQKAAAEGTSEVINAVAASALTNVVVFVPVAMMASVVGLLIAPFAGVMVIVTLVSLFVSFTLTPLLASVLLTKKSDAPKTFFSRFFSFWNKGYDGVAKIFDRTIIVTKRFPGCVIVFVIVACILILTIIMPHISMSFIPSSDKSELSLTLEFPANNSLEATRQKTVEIIKELQQLPYVLRTGTTLGYKNAILGQVSEGVHLAEIIIITKPKSERPPIEDLLEDIRQRLSRHHNMLYNLAIPAATGSSGAQLNAYISGFDFDELEKYARLGMDILRKTSIGTDIDTSCRAGKPRVNLVPNRPILKNLGIDAVTLGTAIVGFFEGVEAGTYKVGSRTYDIRVKTKEQKGFNQADNVIAGSINGKPFNLNAIIRQEPNPVSICLIREDKERSAWIYANPAKGSTLSDMVNVLKKKLAPQLPPGYSLAFFGQAEMMADGARDFADVFMVAIVLTYLLIAAIMESWLRPFLVLFTIPLGFVGMFLAIYLAGSSFSMIGMLGAVMMIGIVVNNAILIMDETAVLVTSGGSTHDAMLTATKNKFRPIIMTSIASVIGMLPMAFGTGLGSEIRSSCGIGVVGGLLFSMFLTLYLIPALYFKFIHDTAYPKASFKKRFLSFWGLSVNLKFRFRVKNKDNCSK
jgi:HAE1 family hydrophobic/amphiphilic exporter-1